MSRDDRCLHQLFAAAAGRVPERVAVVCGTAEICYRDLDRRADRLASFLRGRGVGAEVRVGVCVERSIDMVAAVLGVLKAGGAYVPLDPELPAARLAYLLEDSGAALVLTQEPLRHLLDGFAGEVICLDRDPVFGPEEPQGPPPAPVFPESLAYVVYTSGSTGPPKGVLSTHQGAVSYLLYLLDTYELGPDDCVLQLPSLAFDSSVRDLLGPLTAGATVVLVEPGQTKDPWALLTLIERQRITRVLSIVPTLLRTVLETAESAGGAPRGGLRTLLVSGERLYRSDCERARAVFGPGVEVVNQYGPTECTMTSTYHRVRLPDSGRAEVLIGRPIPGCRVHVFRDGMEVPTETEGELGIAGRGLARGYLGRPDLTADKFRPDPFGSTPGGRLYTAGDLVRRLPDGNCEFIGRVDHQVKLRGVRIELAEIERELLQLPGVRQTAVLLREDKPGEQRLAAYVVSGGTPLSRDEVRGLLEQRLPKPMVPADFVFLEALPVTPNGKLDRRALPAPAEPGKAAGEARPRLTADRAKVFELLLQKKGLKKARSGVIPRREGTEPSVLSFQQERLWFFSQVDPASPAYNMPMALRVTGRLDVPALERTLNELVRRHESLRTTFRVLDGRPVQVVYPPAAQPLPRIDLEALPESVREREAHRLAQAESRRAFDLSRDLLLRGSLLALAGDEHLLLLTAHHISSDGWSGSVLARELGAIYQAFALNRPSPLPELEVQYPDFAEWQRRLPASPALAADLEYWKGRLAGLPQLELPTDRPRPVRSTLRGGELPRGVPAPLLIDLQALARSRESTLFMLLLAALFVLLRHHSGEDDIAVGSPVAGRKHPQTENLIGFFVDWLVMRADLSGEPTVHELLDRVRALTLEAYAHEEPPFQRVIEELAPQRDLSHSPMFQVSLNLQSIVGLGFESLRLPGLEITPVEIGKSTANLDLSLYVVEAPDDMGLRWAYKADLFDATRIARLAGHFENLLRAWTGERGRRISDLPLLGAAERAQLLVEWNDTARRAAPEDRGGLHGLFAAAAERAPGAVAVVCGESEILYRDLDQRSGRLAALLRRRGVGAEVRVAVCLERSIDRVTAVLGVLKAGGAYVPLDPDLPPARIAWMLADSGATLALTQESLLHSLEGFAGEVIRLDRDRVFAADGPAGGLSVPVFPESLAYVVYTSGTTGRAKGVAGTHGGAVSYLRYVLTTYDLRPGDRVLQLAGLAFDASVRDLLGPLAAGATVVLAEQGQVRDPRALLALLASRRITRLLSVVPTLLRALLDAAETARTPLPGTLRTLLVSGERLRLADCSRARAVFGQGLEVVNQYGPTEGTMTASYHHVGSPTPELGEAPIGRPIPDRRFYVLRHGAVVPLGAVGELALAGPGLARGYLGKPDLTARTFLPDPFSETPGARLYATGDLVRHRPDGAVEFLGRVDHQIKLRGVRIEPAEIEGELRRHPGVRQAVVLLREDPPGDPCLVAYVVPRGSPPASDGLRAALEQVLPESMIPAVFVFLEALPLTPSGKVDRRALPAPDRTRADDPESAVAPRTEIERELVSIWQDVLAVEPIGVRDSFFKLGGQSLQAALMMTHVEDRFGRALPLQSLFRGATIEDLARTLQAELEEEPGSSLVPLRPIGSRPAFFAVHPAGGTVACYNRLAGHLSSEQPFHAFQSRGLTTDHEPHRRIEDMASFYVQALRQAQPRGPYRLGGWSFGGLVAYEMALQLEAAGDEVDLLVLIDPHAPGRRPDREVDDARTLTLLGREAGLTLDEEELRRLGPDGMLAHAAEQAEQAGVLPRQSGLRSLRRFLGVYHANVGASQEYLPSGPPLAGPVLFLGAGEILRPGVAELAAVDPCRGWGPYAVGPIRVHTIPGNHFSMLQEPYVRGLAEVLNRFLAEAAFESSTAGRGARLPLAHS